MCRLGGRETAPQYVGSFKTEREAKARKAWVAGELAAMRTPDLRVLAAESQKAPTLEDAAKRWRESRVDVSEATATYHRSALNRARSLLGRLDWRRDSDT
jgi:hypothetical protein